MRLGLTVTARLLGRLRPFLLAASDKAVTIFRQNPALFDEIVDCLGIVISTRVTRAKSEDAAVKRIRKPRMNRRRMRESIARGSDWGEWPRDSDSIGSGPNKKL